jgi:hypothetical protein
MIEALPTLFEFSGSGGVFRLNTKFQSETEKGVVTGGYDRFKGYDRRGFGGHCFRRTKVGRTANCMAKLWPSKLAGLDMNPYRATMACSTFIVIECHWVKNRLYSLLASFFHALCWWQKNH